MQKKSITSLSYYLLIFALSYLFSYNAGMGFVIDDGVRHLFLGNEPLLKGYGSLFPHTYLSYEHYSLWWTWEWIIEKGISFFKGDIHLFVVVFNAIILGVVFSRMFWYIEKTVNNTFFSLLLVFSSLFISLFTFRYINMRPDLFSGIFVLFALRIREGKLLFLWTFLYSLSYYIFWFYGGLFLLLKLLKKEFTLAIYLILALLLGLSFHIYTGGSEYIESIFHVLKDGGYRTLWQDDLKVIVGESSSYFSLIKGFQSLPYGDTVLLSLFSLLSGWAIFKNFKRVNESVMSNEILFTLISLPFALLQMRFMGIFTPLYLVVVIYLSKYYSEFISFLALLYRQIFEEIKKGLIKIDMIAPYKWGVSVLLVLFIAAVLNIQEGKAHKISEEATLFKEVKGMIVLDVLSPLTYRLINKERELYPSFSTGWIEDEKLRVSTLRLLAKKATLSDWEVLYKKLHPDYLLLKKESIQSIFGVGEIDIDSIGEIFKKKKLKLIKIIFEEKSELFLFKVIK